MDEGFVVVLGQEDQETMDEFAQACGMSVPEAAAASLREVLRSWRASGKLDVSV